RNRVCELSCAPAAEEAGELELAGLSPELVPFLDFSDQLELLEAGVEIKSIGAIPASRGFREVENSAAQRPAALIPLRGRTVSVSPAIARVIERAGIDVHPVQKIELGIVRILVGVEYVGDGKPADREHQPVLRLRPGELADVGLHLLGFATEIDGLAEERAL